MTTRYRLPWSGNVWLEFAATMAGILALGLALAWMILSTAGCIVPTPPTPKPPAPVQRTVAIAVTDADGHGLGSAVLHTSPDLSFPHVNGDGYSAQQVLASVPAFSLQTDADGYVTDARLVNLPAGNVQVNVPLTRIVPPHFDPSTVPLDQLARIRGAMWTEQQPCPLGPRPNDPSNICATDFLWNYSPDWRDHIVANLTGLGYTHVVNGPLVDSDGYHGAWTPNDWRGRFDQFLDMLEFEWDHGLAPVVFITPDNWSLERAQAELTPLLQQPRAQRLIRIAVRAWEPCRYECSSYTWAAYGQWLRQTLPNALVLLHTVCDVDAPVGTDSRGDDNGHPNAEGWARVAPFYHGWLTQSCTFENPDGRDDPPYTNFENWTRLFNPNVRGSYIDRFHHGYAGWPTSSAWGVGQPLKVYAGEYYAYKAFWEHGTAADARRWGNAASAQGVDGYLDGGSAPVGSGPVPWQQQGGF